MNTLKEFVNKLTDGEKHYIIDDYNKFEESGVTGDTILRVATEQYMRENNIPMHLVTMLMTNLTMECYRYFYETEH
jgi:hypothetical protein